MITTTELRPCWFNSATLGPQSGPYIPWCCTVLGKFAGRFIATYPSPSGDMEAIANRDDEFELRFIPDRNPKRDVIDIAKAVYEIMGCSSLETDGVCIIVNGEKIITLGPMDAARPGVYYSVAEDALFEVDL